MDSVEDVPEGLLRLSISQGVWAHPEGVTMWGQPWRPLFCDWSVSLALGPLDATWDLTGTDLDPVAALNDPETVTAQGRSTLALEGQRRLVTMVTIGNDHG